MKKAAIILAGLMSFSMSQHAMAEGTHEHGHGQHSMESMQPHSDHHMDSMGKNPCSMKPMESMKEGVFLQKKIIDGYDVSFHVMKAPEGMEHGGSHHVMIKVEQSNNIIVLQAVNSKVTHPNDKSESKMMMKMGDWYMAGYNLDHGGKHQVMVLFKTPDGKKHFAGITYPNK